MKSPFDNTRLELFEELENFVFENQLPLADQAHITQGKWVWNADYWTMEVCKCLRLGEKEYLESPVPEWLDGNPLFESRHGIHRKHHIALVSRFKRKELFALNLLGGMADDLFITQIGWGISIIVASQVKVWEQISGYDQFSKYGLLLNDQWEYEAINNICHYTKRYWRYSKIGFKTKKTSDFRATDIDRDTIMVGHATHFTQKQIEEIKAEPKIKVYIHDGTIIKE